MSIQDKHTASILSYRQPVRLRLSTRSASYSAVFFSHKKPARSAKFQPKRTGCRQQCEELSHWSSKDGGSDDANSE
jgi:hypothetical protein